MLPEPFSIDSEFSFSALGDERLDRRLCLLASVLAENPDESFPSMCRTDAELEATYRFLSNERVTPEAILAPHLAQTVTRANQAKEIIVAHDTTEFNFGRYARGDLGRVGRGKSYGFYGHFSLAIDRAQRVPLGVLGIRIHHRDGIKKPKRGHRELQTADNNEAHRWMRSAEESNALLARPDSTIHVMDREADCYALLSGLVERNLRFVIRMTSDKRALTGEFRTIAEALQNLEIQAERDVAITARRESLMPGQRKRHPPRNARIARLQITTTQVTVCRPDSSNQCPNKTLSLSIVQVNEPNPPLGEEPIEWRLWTSDCIDSKEKALAAVDAYRARWRIEEYFKALKTGCAIEKRQLESRAALLNAIAVFAPIAWRLLLLRTLAQHAPDLQARTVMSPNLLECLSSALIAWRKSPLPQTPTMREVMLGIAALGGHITNNGAPGWIVFGRGYQKLFTFEMGYRAAQAKSGETKRCDQS